ncbi:class I SAM-dependent RNA methyltransferase [bacterium]|nr:class I SAM-dependent RNA methyltransferase [bacterium]
MSTAKADYLYQKNHVFFAQTAGGIEELACKEAETLKAESVNPGFRGFFFKGSPEVLYRLNYQARLITRILAPLTKFYCNNTDDIYRYAWKINWPDIFNLKNTFAVFSNVSNSNITHSKFAALKLKDAIADKFRTRRNNRRPNVDTNNPDIRFFLHINNNKATIYLDTSGDSLHMRGYRKKSVSAPMRETVAAAIIQMIEWNGEQPLYDPMCGSGTLLCEALMHYCRIPSGYLRKRFGFELMPDFNPAVWKKVKSEADSLIRELKPGLISGSDIDSAAFEACTANLSELPGSLKVQVEQKDFNKLDNLNNKVIVTNPPYGFRLNKQDETALIKSFGDFLKQKCSGSTAYVYFGNRELIKRIGLRTAFKKPLQSGGLDGRLCRFDMY